VLYHWNTKNTVLLYLVHGSGVGNYIHILHLLVALKSFSTLEFFKGGILCAVPSDVLILV